VHEGPYPLSTVTVLYNNLRGVMENSCNALGILSHFPTAEWNQQVLLSGSHTFVSLIPPPLPFRSVQECLSSACESDNYPLEPTRGDQVVGKGTKKNAKQKMVQAPASFNVAPKNLCIASTDDCQWNCDCKLQLHSLLFS